MPVPASPWSCPLLTPEHSVTPNVPANSTSSSPDSGTTPRPRTVALVSVGGSPEPVLRSLRELRPDVVWYFCSGGSRILAEEIHHQLDGQPLSDFIEVARFEELGPCYAALREALPRLLRHWRVEAGNVTVDYTGGTKTMSAALVLAATECFSNFSYVGGTQRDKAGTGIVLTGTERVHSQPNPWRELAVRELDQAATLWAAQQYHATAVLLRRTKNQVPLDQRLAFERVIDLATALDLRLSLQLPQAATLLAKLFRKLAQSDPSTTAPGTPAAAPAPPTSLLAFSERAATRFAASAALSGPASDPSAQLRELIDNALLTARLGRHDDAAARLYRALELFGQNELSRLTAGAFYLGQLKTSSIPAALADFPPFAATDGLALARRGIALEQVFRALAHLGHPAGLRAAADFDGPSALKSPWRAATQRRNQSILAHGLQPVGVGGFDTLAALVTAITGEDATRIDLDAPAWSPAWFAK